MGRYFAQAIRNEGLEQTIPNDLKAAT